MNTIEILKAARERISKPGAWIQREAAVDGDGFPCLSTSVGACAWCALGAVGSVAGGYTPDALEWLRRAIKPTPSGEFTISIADFNDADGRTQAEIVTIFDRAIELASRAEAP